jgi:dolichol kinase
VLQNTLVSLALVSVGAGAASLLEQYPGRHRSLVGLVAGLAALGLSLWAAFGS